MAERTIAVRVDGPVAWVVFDRAEQRNTVTAEMVEQLHETLAALAADDSLSVVVLTGAGPTFCPGADVRPGRAGGGVPSPAAYHSATLLHEMPQLTVAAVNGGCAGAGFAWAAACDLRVAAARARFSSAFLPVGVSGELGVGWTLPRAVGTARARELLFLAERFDAAEALRLGFLARVFESWEADLAVLVDALAARDVEAVRTMKRNLLDGERLPLADYVDVEAQRHRARFAGDAAAATYARLAAQAAALGR